MSVKQEFAEAVAALSETVSMEEAFTRLYPAFQAKRERLAMGSEAPTPRLSEAETALLLEVNRGLSAPARERFRTLVARKRAEALTPEEHEEMLRMVEEIERLDGQRLEALVKLAQLRGQPLRSLTDDLGIDPPPVEGLA